MGRMLFYTRREVRHFETEGKQSLKEEIPRGRLRAIFSLFSAEQEN
jgi:hypothetical protein